MPTCDVCPWGVSPCVPPRRVPGVCPPVYPHGVSLSESLGVPPSVGFSESPHYHTELEFRKIIFLLLIAYILYSALLS